jgi:hypothetical protein
MLRALRNAMLVLACAGPASCALVYSFDHPDGGAASSSSATGSGGHGGFGAPTSTGTGGATPSTTATSTTSTTATGTMGAADGTACTMGGMCASGNCSVDGVCCATACTGSCQECKSTDGMTCAAVPKDQQSPGCTGTSACNGVGGCSKADGQGCAGGSQCASGNCSGDGHCCPTACAGACFTCAGATCQPAAKGTLDNGCASYSTTDYKCLQNGDVCACDGAGVCKLEPQASCTQGADCLSGDCNASTMKCN